MLFLAIKYLSVLSVLHAHAFHVSVCEIYFNPDTKSLEITIKLFLDDLELAVQQSGSLHFNLMDVDEDKVDRESLSSYILSQFEIDVNKKKQKLEFLGYEFEDDALLCYVESAKIESADHLRIKNTLITEVYNDQVNLTHVQFGDELKSIKTHVDQPEGFIEISSR